MSAPLRMLILEPAALSHPAFPFHLSSSLGSHSWNARHRPAPTGSCAGPKLRLPGGAWDTHLHIFGPQARFPLAGGRKLEVEDCTLDDLLALHQSLGFSHGLLVQSFQHGHSYEYMLHALSREPKRLRGVTALAPDVTDAEIDMLKRAGVIGTRFVYRMAPQFDRRMVARAHEAGLQAHFMLHGEDEADGLGR